MMFARNGEPDWLAMLIEIRSEYPRESQAVMVYIEHLHDLLLDSSVTHRDGTCDFAMLAVDAIAIDYPHIADALEETITGLQWDINWRDHRSEMWDGAA